MNLAEIRDELRLVIHDSDTFTDQQLNGYINQAYRSAIAIARLPEMKRYGYVYTELGQPSTSLASLPGGFLGWISKAFDEDREEITILPNLESLLEYESDLYEEGDVEKVAWEGNTLWYYKTPEESTRIYLVYYRDIDALSGDADEPSFIPEHVHRPLLVNGAGNIILTEISEDGVEEDRINAAAQFHLSFDSNNRNSGITRLLSWKSATRRKFIASRWSQ